MKKKCETLQTRVDSEIYDKLIILCKIKDISLSQYAKNAITAAFNAEKAVYKALLDAALASENRGKINVP